jgi:hypothetical protein
MHIIRRAAFFLLLAFVPALSSAAEDPFVGTWVLDVASSQYPSDTCPVSMVVEMKSAGAGVQYRSDAIFANGRILHSEYRADYDGNPAIVMGTRGMMLPVFLKRIDAHSVVASYARSLQIVATSKRVVSADGLRMTITTTETKPSGQQLTTIGVFNKRVPSN